MQLYLCEMLSCFFGAKLQGERDMEITLVQKTLRLQSVAVAIVGSFGKCVSELECKFASRI